MQKKNSQSVSGVNFQDLENLKSHLLPAENHIRLLQIGDIVGRPGRRIVKSVLPNLRNELGLNFVIANAENIAGGFGVTEKTFQETIAAGVDVVTLGNHWNDKSEIFSVRHTTNRIVFPQNLPNRPSGELFVEYPIPNTARRIVALNLLGLFAMKVNYGSPFLFLHDNMETLKRLLASGEVIITCDVHAEASSEKQAIASFLNGIAASVIGTHTHVPTSDERLLHKGTAYISDIGMTGPFNSIIGMNVERTLKRYFPPFEKSPHEVANGPTWFCAFLVEISTNTNLAVRAHRLQYREERNEWSIVSTT